jgi:L-rhamnose mutarotase
MIRKAFVMQVNPDAHEEYQRRHNPIWPELEAVLKAHGAHRYAIYLDKQRNLLFATVEIESKRAGTPSPTRRCASAGGAICAM